MTEKRVQVLVDGKDVFDEQVDSREIMFSIRKGHIRLMAGPGTTAAILCGLGSQE